MWFSCFLCFWAALFTKNKYKEKSEPYGSLNTSLVFMPLPDRMRKNIMHRRAEISGEWFLMRTFEDGNFCKYFDTAFQLIDIDGNTKLGINTSKTVS
jgi:hypothetical protein